MWVPMAMPGQIGGRLGVLASADLLTHDNYVEQLLMEAQAGWLIDVEPLEIKLGLTRTIYDDAEHANRLGTRLGEMRMSRGARRAPNRAFLAFAGEVARTKGLAERMVAIFEVLKPALVRAYRHHLTLTDPLLDAPTHLLLNSLIAEEEGHVAWGTGVITVLLTGAVERGQVEGYRRRLGQLLAAAGELSQPTADGGEDDPEMERLPTSPQPIETAAPVRDQRFSLADPDGDPRQSTPGANEILESCHFYINTEMAAAEMCARTMVEFPDLPWELRLDLARQCWDEGRHCEAFYRRVVELGGFHGMRPFNNWLYDFIGRWPDPVYRLTALNRLLEGNALDGVTNMQIRWESLGDPQSAQILEYIVADETIHTRISNWIERLTAHDPERQRAVRSWHAQKEREQRERSVGRQTAQYGSR